VPGITTAELDTQAQALFIKYEGKSSFIGYRPRDAVTPFPAHICVSINDEIVHGVPSAQKIIQAGDVVSLDIGFIYKERVTDMAVTVIAGGKEAGTPQARALCATTLDSLRTGIAAVRKGKTVNDIGVAIEKLVSKTHFNIFEELVGHGVGFAVHEDPYVPNYDMVAREKKRRGKGTAPFISPKLEAGMVLALEPMLCTGAPRIALGDDGWAYVTIDGGLAAHYEATIALVPSADGTRPFDVEVLTPLDGIV
jgi:methionyl aminopeptidase